MQNNRNKNSFITQTLQKSFSFKAGSKWVYPLPKTSQIRLNSQASASSLENQMDSNSSINPAKISKDNGRPRTSMHKQNRNLVKLVLNNSNPSVKPAGIRR